jgi:hypothetical protein
MLSSFLQENDCQQATQKQKQKVLQVSKRKFAQQGLISGIN